LVASLVRTRDVYNDFTRLYGGTTGIISGEEKKARLLAVTTSSSLGRSSVYNRLKLAGVEYLKPIGYTGGWGHFHIPDSLFFDLRAYLREMDIRTLTCIVLGRVQTGDCGQRGLLWTH